MHAKSTHRAVTDELPYFRIQRLRSVRTPKFGLRYKVYFVIISRIQRPLRPASVFSMWCDDVMIVWTTMYDFTFWLIFLVYWMPAFVTEPGSSAVSSAPSITSIHNSDLTIRLHITTSLKSITQIRWLYHHLHGPIDQFNSVNVNHVTHQSIILRWSSIVANLYHGDLYRYDKIIIIM